MNTLRYIEHDWQYSKKSMKRDKEPAPEICEHGNDAMFCVQCLPPEPTECPHGNAHGDCDHCDHLSDIAFDTERERGMK